MQGDNNQRGIKYVAADALRVDDVYFILRYFDHDRLTPELVPVVFVGRNLATGDVGYLYFQDYASFRDGVRFDQPDDESPAVFERFIEAQGTSVCTLDGAIEALQQCAKRRAI